MQKKKEEQKSIRLSIGYAAAAAADSAAGCGGKAKNMMEPMPPASAPVSGDSALSCRLPDGRRALILSDGMGKGARAAAESRLVVKKLKRLLQEGLPAGQAIDRVNRDMIENVARRCETAEESFATVDLALIDQISGKASIYKMGAAPSFVVRGKRIRKMQKPGLPVGIVPRVSPGEASAKLMPGDVIVMVSDGITDSDFRSEGKWLIDLLKRRDKKQGPKVLAEVILDEAIRRSQGRELDDATVMVAVVEEY